MHTIDKHTALMAALTENTTLLQTCQRISIEQKYPPYFRTYIAVGKPMSKEELRKVEDLAEGVTLHANAFHAGSNVNAITFVDMDEKPQG